MYIQNKMIYLGSWFSSLNNISQTHYSLQDWLFVSKYFQTVFGHSKCIHGTIRLLYNHRIEHFNTFLPQPLTCVVLLLFTEFVLLQCDTVSIANALISLWTVLVSILSVKLSLTLSRFLAPHWNWLSECGITNDELSSSNSSWNDRPWLLEIDISS